MANGLRSLKYGIGNQDVGTKGSAQDMLMFLAESIGPGYGLGEYSEGIQDLLEGNISGIPKAGLGLVAALPFGRSISKGAQKVVDKGVDIFHGTSAKNLKKIEEKGLFNPTGRQAPTSDIGIHVATDPTTSNAVIKNTKDATTYLGSLNPNIKPLVINDVNAFRVPSYWKNAFYKTKTNKVIKDDFKKAVQEAEEFAKKKSQKEDSLNFWNTNEGKIYWLNKLRALGKKHNFDSFKYKNMFEGGDKDSLMLLYPQQIKDKFTKVKDWSDPNPMKAEGGSIKDPYKTYNTQRFI
jgi:hypothetical protein|tara:strand:+ start:82 stop:960 length:879 start_codon:yes stop_codon:yes gene_type:complete